MSVAITVMAHPAREAEALRLAQQVGAYAVSLDTAGEGEVVNGLRAWALAVEADADWTIVLQDDAVPVPGFTDHVATVLAGAPSDCVSFYTGTGRPRQDIVRAAIHHADANSSAWLTHPSLLWGVAVALRTGTARDFLNWEPPRPLAYDQRISAYCRHARIRVSYTHPSMVDHADGPTLLMHSWGPPKAPRRAWRVGLPTGSKITVF